MNCREIFVITLFDLILECSRTSANYTKNYGDYNLSVFGNAGIRWSTQEGAQIWCRNTFKATLVSVTSADLQRNIEQFANDAINASALSTNIIVLNAHLQSTDWLWLNGQSLTNTDVQGQSTDSAYLLYAYLLIGNYSLMSSKPTDKRSYLCQFSGETSINCGVNGGFQFQGKCYRKYDDPTASWFDARNSCQNEGGDLASFDYLTRDTFSTLNSSGLYPAKSTGYWVGLKRVKWQWLDIGSEANFTYWFDGFPSNYSKKCLCLYPRKSYNWKWIECDCNEDQQFICFTALRGNQITSDPRSVTKTPTSTWIPSTLGGLRSSMSNDTHPSQSASSPASLTTTNVGLAVGLGVGLSLATVVVILGILLALKTRQLSKKPEGDIGNRAYGGSTVASEGDVANSYEGLRYDSRSNDRHYQELTNSPN